MQATQIDHDEKSALMTNASEKLTATVKRWMQDPKLRSIAVKRHDALEAIAKSDAEIEAYNSFSVEEQLKARQHRQELMLAAIVSKSRVSVNAERHHLASQLGEIFDLADGFADVVLPDDTIWMKTQRDIAALAS
jgi:hypothetical protein